jgi:hypothetical protein
MPQVWQKVQSLLFIVPQEARTQWDKPANDVIDYFSEEKKRKERSAAPAAATRTTSSYYTSYHSKPGLYIKQ